MNPPAPTQGETGTLTKPGLLMLTADWAHYMVIAALRCTTVERSDTTYLTADEAKHGILKTLNWLEAHHEYEWPDFASLHLSFDQAMRLRRALVGDIYTALHRAGSLKLGVPGTPDSTAGGRRDRRSEGSRPSRGRKRICKRDAMNEYDTSSEQSEDHEGFGEYLAAVMTQLADRSDVDLAKFALDKRDPGEVADLLHDSLVKVWDAPRREDGEHVQMLKERANIWQHHENALPKPGQRERATTPRDSSAILQTSPGTALKSTGGSVPTAKVPWDLSVKCAANEQWAETHTYD